ncbi:TfuA-like protein [Streptomyces griseus]|uniref:TfuA-like protein n=1 Tax=Streptomyces griseus TaxID=1911 RepID=UPI0038030E4A
MSHGDFFSPDLESGDAAVVVDGFYHHSLGPRHKEYLYALDRGVNVIGAASIGALRALELEAFGMRGCGAVYELYRAGVFDGDDAVAVAHEAGAPYTSLSVPLVNLHAAAQAGSAAGVLPHSDVDNVISLLRREYYPSRTPDRVVRVLHEAGRAAFARWYERRVADHPHAFDRKREDCLRAVETAHHVVAAAAVGRVTGAAGADWKTLFLRTWGNHFAGLAGDPPLARRIAHQQIFNPRYESVWQRYLEETWRQHRREPDDGPARGLTEDLAERVGVDRFPLPGTRRDEGWLYDFVCPVPDLTDAFEVELLLSDEKPSDIERVALYLEQNEDFTARGAGPGHRGSPDVLSEDAGRLLLCDLWGVPRKGLSREYRSRGIPNSRTAVRLLQPFIVGAIKEQRNLRAESA